MNASNIEIGGTAKSSSGTYGSSYYSGQVQGALHSARVVLGILFETYQPQSVFDLGCGLGGWLAAAEELGAGKLFGVDGPWVDPAALLSRNINFSPVDLEKDFAVREKYDLSISVEVAEHLSNQRSRSIVETLCSASDVVVFSAAIPQQGGVNHINEQWQSFWAELFNTAGYECYDLFRPRLWADKRVESWYRQNLLLYVRRSHPLTGQFRSFKSGQSPLDIVHPKIYEGNLENFRRQIEQPSLGLCCQSMARWIGSKLNRKTGSKLAS